MITALGRLGRTEREILTDQLMTLALYHLASEEKEVGDRLKCMKLVFLNTYDLFIRRAKGLHYEFYRYTYGPFTGEVYET